MNVRLSGGKVWLDDQWKEVDVWVKNDVIAGLGNSLGESSEIMDVKGQFIMPGIIDCHVHISMNGGAHPMRDLGQASEAEALLTGIVSCEELVSNGITTVRECGGIGKEGIIIREAIKAKKVRGPRIVACGQAIKIIGGHFVGYEVTGPTEAKIAARDLIKAGAEYIKLMATGGLGKIGEKPGVVELDVEEMKAAISEGEKHGMTSAAHCHSKEGMLNALEAGVTTLEHCTFLDEEVVEKILQNDVFVIPTFSPYYQMANFGSENGVADFMCEISKKICEVKYSTFPIAYKKGVKIAFGRDAGAPLTRHGDFTVEMSEMEKAGMTKKDIIKAATESAAKAMNLWEETGSIKVGKSADIIVLNEDPLIDLKNYKSVVNVISQGTLIK